MGNQQAHLSSSGGGGISGRERAAERNGDVFRSSTLPHGCSNGGAVAHARPQQPNYRSSAPRRLPAEPQLLVRHANSATVGFDDDDGVGAVPQISRCQSETVSSQQLQRLSPSVTPPPLLTPEQESGTPVVKRSPRRHKSSLTVSSARSAAKDSLSVASPRSVGRARKTSCQPPSPGRRKSVARRMSNGSTSAASAVLTRALVVGAADRLLTPYQRGLVQKSWRKSPNKDGLGIKILLRVFQMSPKVATMFELSNVPTSQLPLNTRFVAHSRVFVRALDTVISNINELSSIEGYLMNLGKIHTRFLSRGFRVTYWELFAEAMTECAIDWEGGTRCKEVMKAWRILVLYVIEMMRTGFQTALKDEKQHTPTAHSEGSLY